MFNEIEYVDPNESKCDECKCSFGIHLIICSKFRPNCKPHGVPNCKRCGPQKGEEGK